MTHLYKVKNKQGKIITFKPNYIQLAHLAERGSHRYNLIIKYRQGGITTLYAIDLLDEALWVKGMSCAITAHEAKRLPEYFNIVKRAFTNLPEQLKPITKTDTKYMYEFLTRFDGVPLDSSIYVATSIRGGTVQKLHITESAFVKNRTELTAGTKQAVPLTGSISEETTGNGFNDFYDTYMNFHNKPVTGDMDYKTYFYPWIIDPDYTLSGTIDDITPDEQKIIDTARNLYGKEVTHGQLLWRRWKMDELKKEQRGMGLSGGQLFKQEYPLTLQEAFQSGVGSVFDPEMVDGLEAVTPLNKLEVEQMYKKDWEAKSQIEKDETTKLLDEFYRLWQLGVWFWELPKKNAHYVIGIDPSDGGGADFSVIDVWDKDSCNQVAQLYVKMRPDEVAEIAAQIGTYYNKAFIGVENNMLSTILFLSKIYDNYYYTVTIDEKTAKRTKKIGYNTNSKTRDLMIDDFLMLFEEGSLTIRSHITISEMRTFITKDNGKREHADGKHDDALFGGFIAMQMRRFYPKLARTFAQKPYGL